METATDLLILRLFERLAAILVGATCVVLGALLLKWGVWDRAASVEVSSGDVKAKLLNASPGLMFAVVGAVLVATTVFSQLKIERRSVNRQTSPSGDVSVIEEGETYGYGGSYVASCRTFLEKIAKQDVDPEHAVHELQELKHEAGTLLQNLSLRTHSNSVDSR